MTDKEEDLKTPAELEAEARERARAELAKGAPDDKPEPGQPIVVKHNKPKGKRTLIVGIISLILLIGLASGGDYVMGLLKGSKEDTPDSDKQASATPKGGTERRGMGQDTNPLGAFLQDSSADNKAVESDIPSVPPPPVAFSKASALAESGGSENTGQRSNTASQTGESTRQQETEHTADSPQDLSYVQCKKILVKGADGKLHCPDGSDTPSDAGQGSDGVARITGVKRLNLDPNLYIPVDRYIPCSLMRRFVSDVAGKITCMISEDVYSANNFVRLIPAGTIARGVYRNGTLKHGQGRMFIAWTELRTPDAVQIPLIDSQVVGQLGEAGIDGWIDTHFWERFGNAMMLSMVQDVAAAAADSAPGKDRNTDYTENTRTAAAEMAKTTLDNSINIPPTMYRNQGDIIGIMTSTDIDFSGVYKLNMR